MFKDINKDESYKCLEIAEKHIQDKQYEKAEKFVLKSKKLFHFPKADGKLKYFDLLMLYSLMNFK